MIDIDLSDANLNRHIESFRTLQAKPSFSISDDTDVNILFLKRKDKYFGVRTADKENFGTRSEFIVYSVLVEEIRARVGHKLVLSSLTVEDMESADLAAVFARAKRIQEHLPKITDIESFCIINSSSDLNWIFLEDKNKYHSLFWIESESRLFSRCA